MNQFINRDIDVPAVDTPLVSEKPYSFSGVIQCPLSNVGSVFFTDQSGNTSEWISGEFNRVVGVDLAKIIIRGTVGDKVTFKGGSW